jgi:hypothetical protein
MRAPGLKLDMVHRSSEKAVAFFFVSGIKSPRKEVEVLDCKRDDLSILPLIFYHFKARKKGKNRTRGKGRLDFFVKRAKKCLTSGWESCYHSIKKSEEIVVIMGGDC